MNKYIKTLAVLTLTSVVAFLVFQKVLAKNVIKINPPVEVLNKHNQTVKSGEFCPRSTVTDLYDKTNYGEEIYIHCKSCQTGAYLPQQNGETRCSFCSSLKEAL